MVEIVECQRPCNKSEEEAASALWVSNLPLYPAREVEWSMIFGKQVEIPCQCYRSLSGSISLYDPSYQLFHWWLFWITETWMARDGSQINQAIQVLWHIFICSVFSIVSLQLMPNHHCSHLAQGCRSRWTMSGLIPTEDLKKYYAIPQMLPPTDWGQRSSFSHHSKFSCWLSSFFMLLVVY